MRLATGTSLPQEWIFHRNKAKDCNQYRKSDTASEGILCELRKSFRRYGVLRDGVQGLVRVPLWSLHCNLNVTSFSGKSSYAEEVSY